MKIKCYKCLKYTKKVHNIRDNDYCDRCVNPNKYIKKISTFENISFSTSIFNLFKTQAKTDSKLVKTFSINLDESNPKKIRRQKSHSFSTFPTYNDKFV